MTMNFLDENPCLRAFILERAFPSGVFGPVKLVKADILSSSFSIKVGECPACFDGNKAGLKTRKL